MIPVNRKLYKIFYKIPYGDPELEYESTPKSGFWITIKTVKKKLENLTTDGYECRIETYDLVLDKNQTVDEFLKDNSKK